MSFVHRLLTSIPNSRAVSTSTAANFTAVTLTSHPYGASGRLTAAPWEGLHLDIDD
ncbi:MAG TPA: hypothetical protein VEI97_09950 [bacterium]|nr:hypothetical protein [bacterium]